MLDIRKASAGSGKTYQLTYEYIRLTLGYTDSNDVPRLYSPKDRENHKKILAITFTNKATEEMKSRIVRELAKLATGDNSAYLENLCDYYKVGEKDIRNSASKSLTELLHNFSDFNVSTIDSFFQTILRTFSREAEVGGEYGIELRDDMIINMGTMDLISSLRRNKDSETRQLLSWLESYAQSKIDQKQNWNIFSQSSFSNFNDKFSLFGIAKQLSTEIFKKHKEALIEYLSDRSRINNFQNSLKQNIEECRDVITHKGLDFKNLLNDYGYELDDIKGAVKNNIANIIQKSIDKSEYLPTAPFLEDYDNYEKWLKKKTVLSESQLNRLIEILSDIVKSYKRLRSYELMGGNLYELGLIGDISKNIETYREENDVILLSDTNELLKRIIGEDDAPFIYERVGMYIQNFLMDEFQDTSKMQWENMKPLLSESLSKDNYNLIIGDEKQSIYRFRNADPSLLQTQVYKDFYGRIASIPIDRSTNYRSDANVIKFNNTFFHTLTQQSDVLESSLIKDTYKNVVQNVSEKAGEGFVKILFIDDEIGDTDNDVVDEELSDDAETMHLKTWDAKAIEHTLGEIQQILDRNYKQSDIAIIVNTNKEGASIIKAILQSSKDSENPLRVISDESLLLQNCPSVSLIINVLQYMDGRLSVKDDEKESKSKSESQDIIALLQRYHSHLSNHNTPSESIIKALREKKKGVQIQDEMQFRSSSLYLIVDDIIKEFISPENLEKDNPFISALQDVIMDYSSHNIPSIHSFLRWWDANGTKISVTSPSNIDAINVLTIHKSKGLEYPCVIIPFTDWNIDSKESLLWVEPPKEISEELDVPPIVPIKNSSTGINNVKYSYFGDVAEDSNSKSQVDNLNKTYVAFTRAAKELYIYSPSEVRQNKRASSKGKISSYLRMMLNFPINEYDDKLFMNLSQGKVTADENAFSFGNGIINKTNKENISDIVTQTMPNYVCGKGIAEFNFELPEVEVVEEDPLKKGKLYHRILSTIDYVDDIDKRVKRCAQKGWILPDEVDIITNRLHDMLSSPISKEWFEKSNKVINERPIAARNNSWRPDRIIITPNGRTIIIDYKFGAAHEVKYHDQVRRYMRLLRDCKFENIEGKIWYPEENMVEEVSW